MTEPDRTPGNRWAMEAHTVAAKWLNALAKEARHVEVVQAVFSVTCSHIVIRDLRTGRACRFIATNDAGFDDQTKSTRPSTEQEIA